MEDFPLPSNMSEQQKKAILEIWSESKALVENLDSKRYSSLLLYGTTDNSNHKDLKHIFENPELYSSDNFFIPSKFSNDERDREK